MEITDGRSFAAAFRKAERIVQQWALAHTPELMANWQRGVDLLPLEMIAGADFDD